MGVQKVILSITYQRLKSNLHSIIFSCWTRTLQLLRKYLDRANIQYLDIDGNCSLKERKDKLEQFKTDKMKPVLIMTTGTGGFGYVEGFFHY